MFRGAHTRVGVVDAVDRCVHHKRFAAAIGFGRGVRRAVRDGRDVDVLFVAQVALTLVGYVLFDRLPDLRLAGGANFGGWAFRGPLRMPVRWGG